MFEVTIKKSFCAAHLLNNIGGYCEHLHGHNFIVEVTTIGEELNSAGILVDFRELKKFLDEIMDALDHKYLNETPAFCDTNPSAENIAKYIYEQMSNKLQLADVSVKKVTVWESENAKASFDSVSKSKMSQGGEDRTV